MACPRRAIKTLKVERTTKPSERLRLAISTILFNGIRWFIPLNRSYKVRLAPDRRET